MFAMICRFCALPRIAAAILLNCLAAVAPSHAADPIRVGLSVALTGAVAANGKQVLISMQVWKDDINASGGLLGRPVELAYYDDQGNPSLVPGIYTKLIEVDKVDLLVGPYATNMVVPAILTVQQHNCMTIGLFEVAANRELHYGRYFSMLPAGSDPVLSFSEGFFAVAMQIEPKPRTVAISGADAEISKVSTAGARINVQKAGLTIVYDKSYPPATTDFGSSRPRDPVNERRYRLQRELSARHGRYRPRCPRSRPQDEDVRRQHDWSARHRFSRSSSGH